MEIVSFADREAIRQWTEQSKLGKVCFLPNCLNVPVMQSDDGDWACTHHSYAFENR